MEIAELVLAIEMWKALLPDGTADFRDARLTHNDRAVFAGLQDDETGFLDDKFADVCPQLRGKVEQSEWLLL